MHRNVKFGALFGALVALSVLFVVGPAEAASTIARFVTSHDPASTSAGDAAIVCDVQNYESNELCFSLSTGTFKVDEDGDATAKDVTTTGRIETGAHAANVGLNLPTKAGACAAVTGTVEGDICWDSTNDALYIYDGANYGTLGTTSYPLTGQALPTFDPAGTNDAQASLYFDVSGFEANEKVLATSTGAYLDEDGDLNVVSLSIGGTAVTATPTNLNQATLLASAERIMKVEVVPFVAADTAGGAGAWTAGARVLIHRVVLDMTTATTGASTFDIGIAAAGTTLSDTLIDGASGTPAAIFDSTNDTDNGTNGVSKTHALGASQYITVSKASGAAAGGVGNLYIYYTAI